MKSKLILVVVSTLVILGLLIGGFGCTAPTPTVTETPTPTLEPVTLVHNSYMMQGFTSGKFQEEVLKEIEERTKGEVRFELNWGGVLGKATDQLELIGRGVIDLGEFTAGYRPDLLSLSSGFELLFNAQYMDVQSKAILAMYSEFEPVREEIEMRNNLRLIMPWGATNIVIATKKPISSLADFKGLRLRSFGYTDWIVEALGAVPVGVSFPEIYEALQRGVIDGTGGNSIEYIIPAKWHEMCKYISDPRAGQIFFGGLMMNLDTWNKLSPQVQETIDQIVLEYIDSRFIEITNQDVLNYTRQFVETGGAFAGLPDEEWEKVRNQVVPALWEEWINKKAEEGLPSKDFLAKFQETIKRYEGRTYLPGDAFEEALRKK